MSRIIVSSAPPNDWYKASLKTYASAGANEEAWTSWRPLRTGGLMRPWPFGTIVRMKREYEPIGGSAHLMVVRDLGETFEAIILDRAAEDPRGVVPNWQSEVWEPDS